MKTPELVISRFAKACLDEAARHHSIFLASEFNAQLQFQSKIGIVISVSGAEIGRRQNMNSNILMCRGAINGDTADILLHIEETKVTEIEMYFQEGESMVNWDGDIHTIEFGDGFV
jgi:hypothetical protein